MDPPRALPVRRLLTRSTPFSYRCGGCGRCCYDKLIQVNPYEVARLAARLGLSTTATLERYTEHGVWLRREPDGACCLLRERRCSVHGDQPLACRLYPLGRQTGERGEQLVELEPHPETAGAYGEDGTVSDFLAGQGVEEYVRAAELYFAALTRLAVALERRAAEQSIELRGLDLGPAGGRYPHQGPLPVWLDVDAMLQGARGVKETDAALNPWQKMELHVEMLADIARRFQGEEGEA